MPLNLGSSAVSLKLGSQAVNAYLGAELLLTGWSPASLLLNFNGADESTTFTDSSPNGLTVTANGNAEISTAQSKFGGSSGLFDGNGDYAEISHTSALNLSGDFTIEAWIYPLSFPEVGRAAVVSKWDTGEFAWILQIDSEDFWFPALGEEYLNVSHGLSLNEWAHIAVVRSGSTLKVFINGISLATETLSSNLASNAPVWIGGQPDFPEWYHGHIDDLRVVQKAVYTANFTPPTAQLGPNA